MKLQFSTQLYTQEYCKDKNKRTETLLTTELFVQYHLRQFLLDYIL